MYQIYDFDNNTFNFKLSRKNSLSQKHWINLFENFRYTKKTEYQKMAQMLFVFLVKALI